MYVANHLLSDRLSYSFSKAGLFSAVSSAFVIDVQSKLQPHPNDHSAALLRAILLTLNQSAIPNEVPIVPPVQGDPPNEIITVTGLMYASLLISLLAAFIAMLSKQWLNRYLRHAGGSMIERCRDRQRKCDGLEKWPFHLFVESLPIMLQVSLLLLTCGLCRNMWPINISVACILLTLTILGMLFYFGIVIAGTSSYECPFQTPASSALRGLWKKVQPHATLLAHPVISTGTCAFQMLSSTVVHPLWKEVIHPVISITHRFEWAIVQAALNFEQWIHATFRPRHHTHHPSPVLPLREIWEEAHVLPEFDLSPHNNAPLHNTDSQTHNISSPYHSSGTLSWEIRTSLSHDTSTPAPGNTGPWLTQEGLAMINRANAEDIRCVSWILWNITDPEALDAAIRFAGTIRWFEDGNDIEPPYDTVISIFNACLDSTGAVYPGLSDRAYHSARAALWIHICARSKSEEFAHKFPLLQTQSKKYPHSTLGPLVPMYNVVLMPQRSHWFHIFTKDHTHTHMQWASQALLHFCRTMPEDLHPELNLEIPFIPWNMMSLDAILNLLLVWSIFLGTPVEEEMLKIQDKTYVIYHLSLQQMIHLHCLFSVCIEQVTSQLSQAIITAIPTSHPRHPLLQTMFRRLAKWDTRPDDLRARAYTWCSVICEKCQDLKYGKDLLFLSLEIGFRGLDFKSYHENIVLVHTDHHKCMVDIIFNSGDGEIIGDFLCACNAFHSSLIMRNLCAKYLIRLQHLASISPRLRLLIIHSVVFTEIQQLKQIGLEEFSMLLDHLNIRLDDLISPAARLKFFIHVIQSPEGRRTLHQRYLEMMVEIAITGAELEDRIDGLPVMTLLEGEEEWDILEYWVGLVWVVHRPRTNRISQDLGRVTLSLFRQRPSAVQKLERWLRRARRTGTAESIECLWWIREQAGTEAVSQHHTLYVLFLLSPHMFSTRYSGRIPSISAGAQLEEPTHLPPTGFLLLVGDDTY